MEGGVEWQSAGDFVKKAQGGLKQKDEKRLNINIMALEYLLAYIHCKQCMRTARILSKYNISLMYLFKEIKRWQRFYFYLYAMKIDIIITAKTLHSRAHTHT